MSVTSLEFLCFFLISLFIYYLFPKKMQWILLLLFSVIFYILGESPYLFIYPAVSILTVYISTIWIEKLKTKEKSGDSDSFVRKLHLQQKIILTFAILINVGLLAALKYADFFIYNILFGCKCLHLSSSIHPLHWMAPLGISFYTLQIIGYLCDSYWGIVKTEHNIFKLALFGCWFPQMTSGPISRYEQISKQLVSGYSFDFSRVTFGMQRMIWGFFKKFVISDRLGLFVSVIYADPSTYSGVYIWLATFAFTLQLYTDFSGCMDIVIGASECFGIVLPENFRTPFFSQSIREFWQRWHITLSFWLKDYIMYPILKSNTFISLGEKCKNKFGKKIGKKIPVYLAMLVLWLAMGMWHGSSWKYIVGEGIWFWLVIVIGDMLSPFSKKAIDKIGINSESFIWRLFRCLRTFFIFSVGMLFFRASSFVEAIRLIGFSVHGVDLDVLFSNDFFKIGLDLYNWIICGVGLVILLIVSLLQERGSIRQLIAKQHIIFRWIIYFGLIFSIIIFGKYGPGVASNEFIYKGF